ncbi:sensor histidine kinase [Leptospira sp. 201903071]|uniref:ATP-binding protein n=1 Tax=Leptospira ainazelensis TaxID=2810034 RepID=UPI001963C526|nr:ATP-binding protein [Leptospira ainazelensis]MBM9500807.1 sensor histidine kinase [Leptospira ainazelensis]
MNLDPEIFICSIFLFLSSVLLWLASTTYVNLEKRDRSATFTISILISASILFGFFSWIGEFGLFEVSGYPAFYFFPGIFGLILIPFGWFFIIIWFVGFLKQNGFYRFIFRILILTQIFAYIFFIFWVRKFDSNLSLFNFWNIVPFSFRLSYLIYIFVCILVPIVALKSFRISKQILPEIAREKAVPYLYTTSLLLLGVWILVFFLFLGKGLEISEDPVLQSQRSPMLFYGFLIGIQLFVAVAILVLGRALISYEIFTGRILPKISLRREWRNAVLGFVTLSGIYLVLGIFKFQKIELFLCISYVYIVSRTFLLKKNKDLRLEENSILRSIMIPEEFSRNRFSEEKEIQTRFQISFEILCSKILETSKGFFLNENKIPFIPDLLLQYPSSTEFSDKIEFKYSNLIFEKDGLAYLNDENSFGYVLCIRVENDHSGTGFLFLGQKIDGGLYAEEEVEIAKAAVAWMLNSLFVESNAQTLSSLQRKHIEEQRIADYKTRQILHDEILPDIHSSILELSQIPPVPVIGEQIQLLTDLHKKVSGFLRELPDTSLEIQRLGLIDALSRRMGSEFEFSWFEWKYDSKLKENFPITKPEILEILFYACRESIRNAVRHSGEGNKEKVFISFQEKEGILIRIKNRVAKKEFELVETAGQGLTIHSALLKVFGGYLTLEFLNTSEATVEIFLPSKK